MKNKIIINIFIVLTLLVSIFSISLFYLNEKRNNKIKNVVVKYFKSPIFTLENNQSIAINPENINVSSDLFSDKVNIFLQNSTISLLDYSIKKQAIIGKIKDIKISLLIKHFTKREILRDSNKVKLTINNLNLNKKFLGEIIVYKNNYKNISYKQIEYLVYLDKLYKELKNLNFYIDFYKSDFSDTKNIYISNINLKIFNNSIDINSKIQKLYFKEPKNKELYFKNNSGKIYRLNMPKFDSVINNANTKVNIKNFNKLIFNIFKLNDLASIEHDSIHKFFLDNKKPTKENFINKIYFLNSKEKNSFTKTLDILMKDNCVRFTNDLNIGLIEYILRNKTNKNFNKNKYMKESITKCN